MSAANIKVVGAISLGVMGAGTAVNYAIGGCAVSAYVRSVGSAVSGAVDVINDLQARCSSGYITAQQAEDALQRMLVIATCDNDSDAAKEQQAAAFAKLVDQGTLSQSEAEALQQRIVLMPRAATPVAEHLATVEKILAARQEAGFLSEEQAADALARFEKALEQGVEPALAAVSCDAHFVTESAKEDADVKRRLFSQIAKACSATTILTSNSSAYIPDVWAADVPSHMRGNCVNVHGFNPPGRMLKVEVAGDNQTSDATLETTNELLTEIGLSPLQLKQATPGFVANVLQWTVFAATAHLAENGLYGSREEIEEAFHSSLAQELGVRGPFACAVEAGIENTLVILQRVQDNLPDVRVVPQMLADAFTNGHHGLKCSSGRGMSGEWTAERKADVVGCRMEGLHYQRAIDLRKMAGEQVDLPSFPVGAAPSEAVQIIFAALLRQSIALVEAGIATPHVIDDVVQGTFGRRYQYKTPPIVSGDLTGVPVLLSIGDTVRPLLSDDKDVAARLRRMYDGSQLPAPEADAALMASLERTVSGPAKPPESDLPKFVA